MPGCITWPFIGDWLIPGSLFTSLSRWSTGWLSDLVEETGSQQSSPLQKYKKRKEIRVFCIVVYDMMLSCEMWSVTYANSQILTWAVKHHWSRSMPPTLAWQLSKLICTENQFCTQTSQLDQKDWSNLYLKLLIKIIKCTIRFCHTDLDFFVYA